MILGAAFTLLCRPPALPAADHAVVLQYHHVDSDTPASTSVTPSQFESHLKYLKEGGFTVWPLERIVGGLREGRELPEKCVGITMDDAYTSVYEKAFPLLTELVTLEYPLAFYELGVMYEKGQATAVDLDKATSLYKQGHPYLLKAAEKNDDSALSYLGEMYLYGRGVSVDRERAQGYFRRIKSELLNDYVKQKLAEAEG